MRPSESADYIDQLDENNNDSGSNSDADTSFQARLVIIATAITGGLLIIVVAAILCEFHVYVSYAIKNFTHTKNDKKKIENFVHFVFQF